MRKMYAGARLRRLREERRMTQAALAKSLDLSPSYLNQLERDQRPLTIPVLLKLNSTFDLDVQFFAADSDARLVSDLHEVLVEAAGGGDTAPITEVEELATRLPEGLETGGGWGDTMLALPGGTSDWNDMISGRPVEGSAPRLSTLLAEYPVALLVRPA